MKYTNFAIIALTGNISATEVQKYLQSADSFDEIEKDAALAQQQRARKDTFDNDHDTASMYDDGWVYSQPGKFQKGPIIVGKSPPEGGPQVETVIRPDQQSLSHTKHHKKHHRNKRDTFDNDQDTASMYDDGWVYSQPGKFQKGPIIVGKFPPGGGKQVETVLRPDQQSLRQSGRSSRDSYDHDPTTASMYDDGHKYSAPGALSWKFAGGPKAEYDAEAAAKAPVEVLAAHKKHHKHHRHNKDTFDHDQDTSSMYDDQWVYSNPGKAKPPAQPAPVEGLTQRFKRDSFDHDPTTASMYDDGDKVKTYSAPGALNWKFAGGPKAEYDATHTAKDGAPKEVLSQFRHHKKAGHHAHHRHHRNGSNRGADTFDNDPDTTSMYDDQHVYSNAGGFKVADPAAKAPALMQHRLKTKDTFDHDPTTTSMYDDSWTFSAPGGLDWKFAGGPKAEFDAAQKAKKPAGPVEVLAQRKDSFDHDPTTASMYDDCDKQKTYSAAGKLDWKFAGGPKAEFDIAQAAKKGEGAPKEVLSQQYRKDTFDGDSGTASMYDDGHVYSEAGQFTVPPPPSPSKQKKDADALVQVNKRTHDTFDPDDKNNVGSADPQDTSVYDDQHTYVAKAGSLVNTPPKKENVQTDVKIDEVTQGDADLAKAAAEWKKQKEEKNINVTKTAVKTANTSVKANATNGTTVAQVKVEAKANTTKVEVKAANTTVKANTTAKANSTDFVDPRPYPFPNPVSLENAQHGASPEQVEKFKVNKEQVKQDNEAVTEAKAAAKVQVKSNSTDFNDPKPFPNPTPVPLDKAQKGDTPDKKKAEPAPPAELAQAKNSSAKANVTQTAVKK